MAQRHVPEIGVFLPVYDDEATLGHYLDSLISQDFEDFVVVAADDVSNDASADVLADYARRDSRIQAFYNKKNLGIEGNFKNVLSRMESRYCLWGDGDDYLAPRYFSTLVRHMRAAPGIMGAQSAVRCVDDADREQYVLRFPGSQGRGWGSRRRMAYSLLTKQDGHGSKLKNCLYIHGLLHREAFQKAVASYPGMFTNERQILAQLALAGDFVFEDQVLYNRRLTESVLRRYPQDPLSLRRREAFANAKDIVRLTTSFCRSELLSASAKAGSFLVLVPFATFIGVNSVAMYCRDHLPDPMYQGLRRLKALVTGRRY